MRRRALSTSRELARFDAYVFDKDGTLLDFGATWHAAIWSITSKPSLPCISKRCKEAGWCALSVLPTRKAHITNISRYVRERFGQFNCMICKFIKNRFTLNTSNYQTN